jgi:hypothetical protein
MVVDCFDALTSDRPYRPRFETAAALQCSSIARARCTTRRSSDGFLALHEAGLNEVPPPGRRPVADPHATPVVAAPVEQDLTPAIWPPSIRSGVSWPCPAACRTSARRCGTRCATSSGRVVRPLRLRRARRRAGARFRGGVETVPPDARISLGDRLSGWVAATRTPIVNSDARLDVDPMLRDESPLQSALAVPIGNGERLGGVLAFYSDRQAAFTPVHQRMAKPWRRLSPSGCAPGATNC